MPVLTRTLRNLLCAWLPAIALAAVAAGCGPDEYVYQTPLASSYPTVSVVSDPPGADIFVDGSPTGVVTPYIFTSRITGERTVTLRLGGYADYVFHQRFEAGQTTYLTAKLLPVYTRISDPDSLVRNVIAAYARRDTARYAQLIDPRFVFRVQPRERVPGGPDSLDRAQELEFARRLFQTGSTALPAASRVSLGWVVAGRTDDTRPGHPPGGLVYTLNGNLAITTSAGSLLVNASSRLYVAHDIEASSGDWRVNAWEQPNLPAGPLGLGRLRLIYLDLSPTP